MHVFFFSFGHCIICLSLAYELLSPLWYLHTFLLLFEIRVDTRGQHSELELPIILFLIFF